MKEKNEIWIVEMLIDKVWKPTVGAGVFKNDGNRTLEEWKLNNPDDKFRLVKYQSIK
jgi:hypothetical protein